MNKKEQKINELNHKWHMFECVEVLIGNAFLQKNYGLSAPRNI